MDQGNLPGVAELLLLLLVELGCPFKTCRTREQSMGSMTRGMRMCCDDAHWCSEHPVAAPWAAPATGPGTRCVCSTQCSSAGPHAAGSGPTTKLCDKQHVGVQETLWIPARVDL